MSTGYDTEFEAPVEKAASDYYQRPTSKLAVTSLAFGTLGLTFLPLVGSIVAVATGHAALGEIRESGGRLDGKSWAKTGLGLGYFAIILALVALVIVASLTPWMMETETRVTTPVAFAIDAAKTAPLERVEGGQAVKMVNQMVREDFQLVDKTEAGVKPGEIIAYYNAGATKSTPEFAVLTTDRLVYLNDGRKTLFELKDVAGIKDDKSFEAAYNRVSEPGHNEFRSDLEVYHIEVRSKQGTRMRIDIRPPQDGALFFDALKSALQGAGMTISPDPAF